MGLLKQFWITGVYLAFAAFGIKVGLGLAPYLFRKQTGVARKSFIVLGTLLIYLGLFCGIYLLITHFELSDYIDRLLDVTRYAMLLHLAMAMGLLLWGASLIFRTKAEVIPDPSIAPALLLILPCPVCATVILLNLTLSFSVSSHPLSVVMIVSFLLFSGIILSTLVLIYFLKSNLSLGSRFLGGSMCLVAAYFLLTVIIAPIYPQIKAAYAMACSNNASDNIPVPHLAMFVAFIVFLAAFGFIRSYFSTRGDK
ncbi:MAG: hypothetical protein DRH11_13080 [Deltaproteobacteria bacterium]|nr:hypothetical protein [Deltaproteobacteria bacterium]MBW1935696.1 hypothetical protein [Deltaproteobacteria bacterium]MBW2008697.1 hypothetical protein [Deltaproteobacteria bacterium]RLB31590.1 MAG: hypothetical protein DRH11_13080 [Deltaproteobacteria bacterium]